MSDFIQIKGKTEYKTILGDSVVKLGGSTDVFVPNINISNWKDEAWLNINHKDFIIKNETEKLNLDKSIEIVSGAVKHKFYIDQTGKLNDDIYFASPDDIPKVINFDLAFPKGLDFYYQPELTKQEILDGNIRHDDIVGSYAVYYNKKNNQYKAGKFCHIHAFYFVDTKNNKIKVPIEIDKVSGELIAIKCDKCVEWLKYRTGEIILDPIIGYNTEGASSAPVATSRSRGTQFNSGANQGDGSVAEIHAYINVGYGTAEAYLGIYDDSSGEPNNLITNSGVSVSLSNLTFEDKSVTYSTQPTGITGSTDYWLSVCKGSAASLNIAYDTGGTGRYHYTAQASCNTSTWNTAQDNANTYKASIWIVTDSSSSTTILPIIMNHQNNIRA